MACSIYFASWFVTCLLNDESEGCHKRSLKCPLSGEFLFLGTVSKIAFPSRVGYESHQLCHHQEKVQMVLATSLMQEILQYVLFKVFRCWPI